MKLDKLAGGPPKEESDEEIAASSATTASRTAKLKKKISSRINKVVSRKSAENGNTSGSDHAASNGNHDNDRKSPQKDDDNKKAENGSSSKSSSSSSSSSGNDFRRGSFSYLNLLNSDETPHRTQHITGAANPKRRNSLSGGGGGGGAGKSAVGSVEYLNQTSKSDLMARSNPIGLAEPKVKRDGYAVGRDGSFYRSSEHIFAERRTSSSAGSERRASTSSLYSTASSSSTSNSSPGFRHGSGLIATGRPSNNLAFCMPFGSSKVASKVLTSSQAGRKVKKTSSASAKSSSTTVLTSKSSSKSSSSTKTTSKTSTAVSSSSSSSSSSAVSTFIQKGISEIESLTKAAVSGDGRGEEEGQTARQNGEAGVTLSSASASSAVSEVSKELSSSRVTLESTFKAVDVEMKSNLLEQQEDETEEETHLNFTIARRNSTAAHGSGRNRSRSVTTNVLPEQKVTISLPASRRTSRQPSVDREASAPKAAPRRKTSCVEVFSGTYEMKLPRRRNSKKASSVTKVSSSLVVYSVGSDKDDSKEKEADDVKDESLGKTDDVAAVAEEKAEQKELGQETEGHQDGKEEKFSSDDEKKKDDSSSRGVGDALKGLSVALENLQEQQRSALINGGKNKNNKKNNNKSNSQTTSATVSLRSSRRASRACSPDRALNSSTFRSRRNSMDLYTADVDLKINKKRGSVESLVQKSTCHIRCDDDTVGDLRLCARCHSPLHDTGGCAEFGALGCPRCLEWKHWEDTCPQREETCKICQLKGHASFVHTAKDYKQRRMVVDTLGWEAFREWFYEGEFRSWWQLNGCVGVPLYKIYRRNTEWKKEVAPLTADELNNNEVYNYKPAPAGRSISAAAPSEAADAATTSLLSSGRASSIVDSALSAASTNGSSSAIPIPPPMPPPKRNYGVERDDSIEELVKAIKAPRKRLESTESLDSGRSTPEHLKKYSGSAGVEDEDDDDKEGGQEKGDDEAKEEDKAKSKSRGRTFSETLKLLDDDILAELDVN